MNMHAPIGQKPEIRHDWTREEAQALYELPFNDL
ncbi:MAG: hypothetical protein RIQ68_2392, partial [Pseudomonadota bacterium]